MAKNRWKKFRPDSNPELEAALYDEKSLTARWYARMTVEKEWQPGEKISLAAMMESVAQKVNRLLASTAADNFAALPDE